MYKRLILFVTILGFIFKVMWSHTHTHSFLYLFIYGRTILTIYTKWKQHMFLAIGVIYAAYKLRWILFTLSENSSIFSDVLFKLTIAGLTETN